MKTRLRQMVAVAATVVTCSGTVMVSNAGTASAAADTSPIQIGIICSCSGPLAASIAVAAGLPGLGQLGQRQRWDQRSQDPGHRER